MIRFFISLLHKRRKISSPFGFFEVDKEVYFDWNKYNFTIKKIVTTQLSPEKREFIKRMNQKIRSLDDHPLLYSLLKVKKEIADHKKLWEDDLLFLQEIARVESKFTFDFEKRMFEIRLRAILEHLEYVSYTNIISKKDISEEVAYIEQMFQWVYELERLTKKVKVLLDKFRFEKQSLHV